MYPMRFPPLLLFILAALILIGGFELFFKFALIAALFLFFGKFYPGHPAGRPHHRPGRGHHGHFGHHGHHRHPRGRRHGHGRGPWAWDWDESDGAPESTERPKQKNAPQDDGTVDAEAWV